MSRNSRNINYTLRIAKSVERKMLCNIFQKLSVFHPLEDYRYIGFGALYFADFYLIHRQLGIKKMVSIEKSNAKTTKARYNFNKPFSCIDIKFDSSSAILPEIKWKDPTIVWLDYTDALSSEILTDLDTILRNAISGSFLIISVNAESKIYDSNDKHLSRLDVLRERIGSSKIPRKVNLKQISNRELPVVYNQILNKEVENILLERNAGTKNKMKFFQLLNLKYNDNAPMYSFGGLLLDSTEQEELFDKVKFNEMIFACTGEEYFEIQVPNLTFKEIKFLESIMPDGVNEKGEILDKSNLKHIDPEIPKKDVLKFTKIYQYFPTFAETNLG